METLGAAGAGLLILVETVFPPLPSEVILPLAGFSASRGDLSLSGAIVATTVGSVVGALLLYALSGWLGRERCLALWCRLPLVNERDFVRAEQWFDRHGAKAVLIGRLLPGIRSLISVPAGITRMPLWQFTSYTLVGSLVWNSVFILAGYELGEQYHRIEGVVGQLQYAVLAVVALAVTWWTVRRVRSRRDASSS